MAKISSPEKLSWSRLAGMIAIITATWLIGRHLGVPTDAQPVLILPGFILAALAFVGWDYCIDWRSGRKAPHYDA